MFRRIAEAWGVLWGKRTTPPMIEAQWAEYQQIFRDLLEQFSSSLARQAKAEKKRLDRLVEVPREEAPAPPIDDRAARKAALRARMTGGGVPSAPLHRTHEEVAS